MSADETTSYQVVTYVDRFEDGHFWEQPVRRVSCPDEPGAMFEAVRSLTVAATQPGLYWSEWEPTDPAGRPNPTDGSGVPNRALLRADGEIGLDLVAMRGHAGARGTASTMARSATPFGRVEPAAPARRKAAVGRPAARGAEGAQRPPREHAGWSLPELMREDMLYCGRGLGEIARALGDRFTMRPRVAWRHALGWSRPRLVVEYNWRYSGAGLTVQRVSDREQWPLTGHRRPSPEYLVRLAATYGHGCTPADLVDAHDLDRLGPIDWATVITAVNATDKQRGAKRPHGGASRSSGARSRRTT